MITIGKPYLVEKGNETFLISKMSDDSRNDSIDLWYSVSATYGSGLSAERADAFLLLVLHIAMKTGQDILVKAPVSAKLLFNIENTIQPLFVKAYSGVKHVRIQAEAVGRADWNTKAVGCCCSLGVDSFSSFLKHMDEKVVDGYRITHLTLFNCGQLGDSDLEGAEKNLRETIVNLKPFADEVGLPIVSVNSNINELYLKYDVTLLQSFVLRTASCALALQKLFGKYVYSSSYSVSDFLMSSEDESHMEAAFAPLLGSENLEFILSNPAMKKEEKTEYLSAHPITSRYLDVCWAAQWAYGFVNNQSVFEEKVNKNCGKCDKCLRTILTLDLLGRLSQYEELFDMDYYRKNKDKYILKVIRLKDSNVFYRELSELINEKNIPLSFRSRVFIYDTPMNKMIRIPYNILSAIKHKI